MPPSAFEDEEEEHQEQEVAKDGGKDRDQDDKSSGIGSMHDSGESSDSEQSNCSSEI